MPKDVHICKLSNKSFDALQLKYGQIIGVNTPNTKTICEVKSLDEVSTFNGMIMSTGDSIDCLESDFVEKYSLKAINKANVSSVTVVIYVNDAYIMNTKKLWPGNLNDYCKKLLQGKLVSAGLLLSFNNSDCKADIEAIEVVSLSNKDAQCCIVTASTTLIIERFEQFQNLQMKNTSHMNKPYIKSSSLKQISSLLQPKHEMSTAAQSILVWGPSGSGKATMVTKLAEEHGASIINFDATHINNMNIKSVLKFCKGRSSKNKKCFLILNRVDQCTNQFLKSMISKLIEECDFHGKIFYTATNLSDVKLAVIGKVFVGLPSREERIEYFYKYLTKVLKDESDVKHVSHELASLMEGRSWRDINTFVDSVVMKAHDKEESELNNLKAEDFLSQPGTKKSKEVHVAHEEVSPVLGCDQSKQELVQAIFWPKMHMNSLHKMNLSLDRAILLHGVPGCGKTSLVRMFAHQSKMTLFSISAADIYSPYFGNSEKQLVDIFVQAKASTPSIIFFDEIDCLAGNRRSGDGNSVQNRVACTLFLCMDSIGCSDRNLPINDENRVVLIATTNIPDKIDQSLRRRFDKIIQIELPDTRVRLEILKHYVSKIPIHPHLNVEELAELTESWSGADLECLCKQALQLCMRDYEGKSNAIIEERHFKEALEHMKKEFKKF